jgi:hypothetical protein
MNLFFVSKILFVLGGLAGSLPIDAGSRPKSPRPPVTVPCMPAEAGITTATAPGTKANADRTPLRKKKKVARVTQPVYEDLVPYLPVH